MNVTELSVVTVVLGCPLAAAAASVMANAGWWTAAFVAGGLAFGCASALGVDHLGRRLLVAGAEPLR